MSEIDLVGSLNLLCVLANKPCVYVLECADSSFYVGHTSNLVHRIIQHAQGHGSYFTQLHGFKRVVEVHFCDSELDAKIAELRLKESYKDNRVHPCLFVGGGSFIEK